MIDVHHVPALFSSLQQRFMFVTLAWCTGTVQESFERQAGRPPRGEAEKRVISAHAAYMSLQLMSEFFFGWLLQIETIAKKHYGGIVRLGQFDDALTYLSGQTIYDLFAGGYIHGPYVLPWDNATAFRENVLKPAASLMRSYQKDSKMKIPPEAKLLLELRGLTVEP